MPDVYVVQIYADNTHVIFGSAKKALLWLVEQGEPVDVEIDTIKLRRGDVLLYNESDPEGFMVEKERVR